MINEVFDRTTGSLPIYTLSGNHDMYSGGAGFYNLLPLLNPSPPFAAASEQPASYFSLRTTDGAWQLLAMDTGLHDHDPFSVNDAVTYLEPSEEAWHVDKIQSFAKTGGKTVLLSHHQLFSAFSGIGKLSDKPLNESASNPKLLASWKAFAVAGNVAAWFWGHEHNLCVYQPYHDLTRGRCIGHGAIPVLLEQKPYEPLRGLFDPPVLVPDPKDPSQPFQLGVDGGAYRHGYVLLRLEGAGRAEYYEVGNPHPTLVEVLS